MHNIWNITRSPRVLLREDLFEESMKNLPRHDEPMYYWHVEKRQLKKVGCEMVEVWVYVRDIHGSKRRAADLFRRFFQRPGQPYRLRLVSRLGN